MAAVKQLEMPEHKNYGLTRVAGAPESDMGLLKRGPRVGTVRGGQQMRGVTSLQK